MYHPPHPRINLRRLLIYGGGSEGGIHYGGGFLGGGWFLAFKGPHPLR
ncbi:MAG: hypothetical protein ABSA11_04520 [Candidatus Bathyarchaeia archaeon]